MSALQLIPGNERLLLHGNTVYAKFIKAVNYWFTMEYKQVKFRLSSWNKLRRAIYGRKDENFSDYIERVSEVVKNG